MGLIKHIVMFRLKEDSSEEDFDAVCNGLLALPEKTSTPIQHELGRDLLLPGGQNHATGKNRQIVWSVYFRNVEDFTTYDQHPAHKDFLKNTMSPRVQPGSRAAIQFETATANRET